MSIGGAQYRGVRGCAGLSTAPLAPDHVPPERLAPGEMRRVPFAGELLGAARVRGRFAPIPLDAFDRISALLEAEEQAVYLHLLRLSYGEGRNWARAGKRELMARTRLSERRLLRVLDALVERGFARPLHRDNRGTLWRVALPREALGEPLGDDVLLGRAGPAPVGGAPPDGAIAGEAARRRGEAGPVAAPAPARAPGPAADRRPASSRGERTAGPRSDRTAALARALAAARGDGEDPAALARAIAEVEDLLDEGQSPARVAAAIAAVGRRTQRGTGEA